MQKSRALAFYILVILSLSLAGCAFLTPTPVQSSWAEQLAAMNQASVKKFGTNLDGFVLISVNPRPLRADQIKVENPDEPIELRTICVFLSASPVETNSTGQSLYALRTFLFNDQRLATSLEVDNEILKPDQPDPVAQEQMAMIQVSPQEALQSTLEEGRTFLDKPVAEDNFDLWLEIGGPGHRRLTGERADRPIWFVSYAGKQQLTFWVDAQTGEILKLYTESD